MLNYFRNKKTGGLVALDSDTNEITEYEPISAAEEAGGADIEEPKRSYKRKVKKLQDLVVGKEKNGEHCTSCGRLREKGKYFCKGLCGTCYSREVYRKKHGIESKGKKESRSYSNKYKCIDCGEEITSTLEADQVKCPKNSHHTMVQK